MKDQPDYERKRGNTKLPIEGQFTDDDGDALDISDAVTVEFYLEHQKAGDMSISSEAEIENANQGEVIYHLEPGELGEPGRHIGEFVAIWEDGIKWSAPSGAEFIYVDLHETTDRDLPEAQTGPRDYEVGTLTAETVNTETLEGLSDEELDTLTGPGLSNDNGALTVTAEFEGVEGLTNPLVENVNADGYRITELGEPQDLVDAARLSEVDEVSSDVDELDSTKADQTDVDDLSNTVDEKADREGDSIDTAQLNNTRVVAPSVEGAFDTVQDAADGLGEAGGAIHVSETCEESEDITLDEPVMLTASGGGFDRDAPGDVHIDLNGHSLTFASGAAGSTMTDVQFKNGRVIVGETGEFGGRHQFRNVTIRDSPENGVTFRGGHLNAYYDISVRSADGWGWHFDFSGDESDYFNQNTIFLKAHGCSNGVLMEGYDADRSQIHGNDWHRWNIERGEPTYSWQVDEYISLRNNVFLGYGIHDGTLDVNPHPSSEGNVLNWYWVGRGDAGYFDFPGEIWAQNDEIDDLELGGRTRHKRGNGHQRYDYINETGDSPSLSEWNVVMGDEDWARVGKLSSSNDVWYFEGDGVEEWRFQDSPIVSDRDLARVITRTNSVSSDTSISEWRIETGSDTFARVGKLSSSNTRFTFQGDIDEWRFNDSDISIDEIGSGVIIRSPDGSRWRITVDDDGNLGTDSV